MVPTSIADVTASNNQYDPKKGAVVFGQEKAEQVGEYSAKQEALFEIKDEQTVLENERQKTNIAEQAKTDELATDLDNKTEEEVISTIGSANSSRPKVKTLVNNNEQDSIGTSKDIASTSKPSYYDFFSGIKEKEGDAIALADTTLENAEYEFGNISLLADSEMQQVFVEQPFSELKSKELQLANAFLGRMNKQISSVWTNPYKGQHLYKGIIKFELDENGYLQDAYVYRSSGHPALDASVINAIMAVTRFEVPENKILANRYYTHLRYHYSSIASKTELMPFQKETEKEK